jgi:undecaprenyl-diphosphatase
MTVLQASLLGFVQGVTEFLPMSSSGHLVLTQSLLKIHIPQILAFDVFVHAGTLLSILVAFRKDIYGMLKSFVKAIRTLRFMETFKEDESFRMAIAILVGSIPTGFLGLVYYDLVKDTFSDPKLAAVNLVITGLFLFLTRLARPREGKEIGMLGAIFIGFAQALSMLPGISRSGTTISTAMYMRVKPAQAARFSFLLAIPAIGGASILEAKTFFKEGIAVGTAPLLVGALIAAIAGFLAIVVLMKIVERGRLSWFSLYCLAVGILGIIFV